MDKRRLQLIGGGIATVISANVVFAVKGGFPRHPAGVFCLEFCWIVGACLAVYLLEYYLPRD
jgi:hypothetical protein